jgi:hypothetical protein
MTNCQGADNDVQVEAEGHRNARNCQARWMKEFIEGKNRVESHRTALGGCSFELSAWSLYAKADLLGRWKSADG